MYIIQIRKQERQKQDEYICKSDGSFSPLIESDAGMYIHHSDRSTVNVIPWTSDQIYSFGAGYSSLQPLDSQ